MARGASDKPARSTAINTMHCPLRVSVRDMDAPRPCPAEMVATLVGGNIGGGLFLMR